MIRPPLLWLACVTLATAPAFADEVDDLFTAPPPDVVTGPVAAPKTAEPVRPFLSLNSWAAGAFDGVTPSFYFQSDLTGGLDFRPDDALRIFVSLATTLPNGSATTFSPPSVAELFLDYSLADLAVVRVGQFGMTWGQARLVPNSANLVAKASSGTSAKATVPLPGGTLVLVASGAGALDSKKLPASRLFAASTEQSWGPFTVGLSGSHSEGVAELALWKAASFVRTSWAGADWYVEGVGTWGSSLVPDQAAGTAGVLWQGGFPVWTVNGEFQYVKVRDGVDNDTATSEWAISLDTKRPWGFVPKVLWGQDWRDRSGQLSSALVFEPVDHLTLTAALPWVYGAPGSHFVAANADPEGRSWALGIKAAWAWAY